MNDKSDGIYLLEYECMSAAGIGVKAYWDGLTQGRDHSKIIEGNEFHKPSKAGGRVCFISHEKNKCENRFEEYFRTVWMNLTQASELQGKGLCLISSTKGILEDYIWDAVEPRDPFTSLYPHIRKITAKQDLDFLTVSQACSSSHIAIEVADKYLREGIYEYAIIVSFDMIGAFIYNGFNSLKVLSSVPNQPFSNSRQGLQLGESLAVLLLTPHPTALRIKDVANKTLPSSVTRPSLDGAGLVSCLQQLKTENRPELVIAHGTGTQFNDLTEDTALNQISVSRAWNFKITSTKWSIGHCLGASGAMDIIAASECLRRQEVFGIANTTTLDSAFKNQYLIGSQYLKNQKMTSALVTSLGFGGVQAALLLEKV